jgi:hypothetical protein
MSHSGTLVGISKFCVLCRFEMANRGVSVGVVSAYSMTQLVGVRWL